MNEDDIFSDPDNQLSQFHEQDWFDAYRDQRDKVTPAPKGEATDAVLSGKPKAPRQEGF